MATMDQVRKAMHTAPFRPFTVYLADGRTYLVRHPDFISISTNGREMVVHDEVGMHLVDMRAVVEVHLPYLPEPAEGRPVE
ncbi:MAG: hypothetical protein BGO49_10455 [Planctomycetales bacterium 71-10]|nr:MAG: hypothetical protein BGO49_10455 [Planctomycetales bacterium 71-10]